MKWWEERFIIEYLALKHMWLQIPPSQSRTLSQGFWVNWNISMYGCYYYYFKMVAFISCKSPIRWPVIGCLPCRRDPGPCLPPSAGWGPLRHVWEVDAERTQGTQPVHGDRPRDRTHPGIGALTCPPRPHVPLLQETGAEPGAQLGWHHCCSAALRWGEKCWVAGKVKLLIIRLINVDWVACD